MIKWWCPMALRLSSSVDSCSERLLGHPALCWVVQLFVIVASWGFVFWVDVLIYMGDHGFMSLRVSSVRPRRKWLPPATTRQREHPYRHDSATGRCTCGLPRQNMSHTVPGPPMGMLSLLESVWKW